MWFSVRLRGQRYPQAFLVILYPVLVLLYSLTEGGAQEAVAVFGGDGPHPEGAGQTTEAGVAIEARNNENAAPANTKAIATHTLKDAGFRRGTTETAVSTLNSLGAQPWSSTLKGVSKQHRWEEGGGTTTGTDTVPYAAAAYDKRGGTLPESEGHADAANGRRKEKSLVESTATTVRNTESEPLRRVKDTAGVRDALSVASQRSPPRGAAAARDKTAQMPAQLGAVGAIRRMQQDAGLVASGDTRGEANDTGKGLAAKAAAAGEPPAVRSPAPGVKPRQTGETGAASAGDGRGREREPEAANLRNTARLTAWPPGTAALAAKENHRLKKGYYKHEMNAVEYLQTQSEPGGVVLRRLLTSTQHDGYKDVGTEVMDKQEEATEDTLQPREDSVQHSASPWRFAEKIDGGGRKCRDWRRNGPHDWLLNSPFFEESATAPPTLEFVLQLLPFLFYGVDEEGDVIMYLQLSAINIGAARTLLSDELLRAVFRFRFFAVFGWLAPAPDARAKVFIDAREFKVTDALLHGGLSLAIAFAKSFASTMGQTPLTATPSTSSNYSVYSSSNSSASSQNSHRGAGYDTVTTQVAAISDQSNKWEETDYDNTATGHSKRNGSSRSLPSRFNTYTKSNNSSNVNRQGVDRLREVHVLQAPLGSAVFFRVAQAIVGVRLPLYFYSSPVELLGSKFAAVTGIANALVPGLRGRSHAWTQRGTVPSRQPSKHTNSLRRGGSRLDDGPGRPHDISRHRRNRGYTDEARNELPEDLGIQSETSSHEAFPLEKCFSEYVAYLRSEAMIKSLQPASRQSTKQAYDVHRVAEATRQHTSRGSNQARSSGRVQHLVSVGTDAVSQIAQR